MAGIAQGGYCEYRTFQITEFGGQAVNSKDSKIDSFRSDRRMRPDKGQLGKLNGLRKSISNDIGERAFAQWLKTQRAAVPADKNAERIADALWPLIQQDALRIPGGGYIVKRGRDRMVIKPVAS